MKQFDPNRTGFQDSELFPVQKKKNWIISWNYYYTFCFTMGLLWSKRFKTKSETSLTQKLTNFFQFVNGCDFIFI